MSPYDQEIEQDPPDPDDFDTMIDEQDDLFARGGYDEC